MHSSRMRTARLRVVSGGVDILTKSQVWWGGGRHSDHVSGAGVDILTKSRGGGGRHSDQVSGGEGG